VARSCIALIALSHEHQSIDERWLYVSAETSLTLLGGFAGVGGLRRGKLGGLRCAASFGERLHHAFGFVREELRFDAHHAARQMAAPDPTLVIVRPPRLRITWRVPRAAGARLRVVDRCVFPSRPQ
jgi:hypothetical protein